MSAEVWLPLQIRELLGMSEKEAAAGGTVGEIFADLDRRYPGLADRLLDGERLRPYVRVFVDRDQADLDSPVPAGAQLRVVAAVAGGACIWNSSLVFSVDTSR